MECLKKIMTVNIVGGLFLLLFSFVVQADYISGKVIHVSDGDTLTILTEQNKQIKIRLDGIDAPEKAQPFGNKAKQALTELVFQKQVLVNISKEDRYGRSIGRVYVKELDVSAELVKLGMAWVYRKYTKDENLYALENEAQQSNLGLWSGSEAPIPPWDWRKGKHTEAYKQGLIIGNRNSNVYHLPDCPSYGKVSENNQEIFSTEGLAVTGGYRKAGNCP
jgi:micrococcal nuclease